ncbi:MAG: 30S ribosomal protein S8 [Spirochaetota bacterium]
MSATIDPIADMLVRLKNAIGARHPKVDIPSSQVKVAIAKILKDEGYIKNYKIVEDNKQNVLRVYLKYSDDNSSSIILVKRISTPGRRVYVKAGDLKPVFNNMGIWILSTPKGVMTNKAAKQQNVGGELICEIA